jgi:hypothetical protein
MSILRPKRPGLSSLNHETMGRKKRSSKKIGRSTQLVIRIVAIVGTASDSPLIRKRKDHSDDMLTPISVKSIAR